MANDKPYSARSAQQETQPRMYSPDLQPLLQSLLGTLADIDFEYERERDNVNGRTMDMSLKIRLLEKLKQHHRERREPYLQQLAILHERIHQITQ
jgi:tryptophanyl-tRNA synthetase